MFHIFDDYSPRLNGDENELAESVEWNAQVSKQLGKDELYQIWKAAKFLFEQRLPSMALSLWMAQTIVSSMLVSNELFGIEVSPFDRSLIDWRTYKHEETFKP